MAGRPVQTGQELLRVADPERIALEIRLPVADAMVLKPGAPVALFLDADPLQEVNARIERSDYRPTLADDGTLAYRVTAGFEAIEAPLRIGLRGTARVEGPSVRLFYYLFRRPLTAARQWLGW